MPPREQSIQGGIIIQSREVSSTTELFEQPFQSNFSIRGRNSYRARFPDSYHRPRGMFTSRNDPNPNNFLRILRRIKNVEASDTKVATFAVGAIFLSSIFALFLVYSNFPEVTDEERKDIKLPWNIEDAKKLGIVLSRYKTNHYYHVMSGVFISYIFLQTFAIPGSLFLSILSGFLFPFFVALILVCTCSMVGASLCFLLSQLLGRKLVRKYFPERAAKWAAQVEKHRDNLFNYVVFLRVTPFLPNWFINLTAPVIGVPLVPFAFGTFVGVAPPSFIAIQGGQTLQNMTETDSAFSMQSLVWLIIFGVISLIPIFMKNRLRDKIE